MSGAFDRYAPFIREYIYRKNWTQLRRVQSDACGAIMDTDRHVIIASGTASGKTEAAFFPILTMLERDRPASVGVLYIGPLKALINDQFERLSELMEERDIPVWPWHGDVSAALKKKAVAQARGVVQITPESLEAMLMLHAQDAKRLFSDLRFVVIDEIHAFMGTDRGAQLLCLLKRLEMLTGRLPRRIGLSATLHEYGPAMEFLCAGRDEGALAVGMEGEKRRLSLGAECFEMREDGKGEEELTEFLYANSSGKKCLLFVNSRAAAEETTARMKEIARDKGERDVFSVHHGSVSAQLRHEAESAMKGGDGPHVTAATLTLELGIDIGDLDRTLQLGPPLRCAGFVQRLGRSGRRSGRSEMLFALRHAPCEGGPDILPWDLLQTIAVVQLYLEERWVEPFEMKKKPLSLLAHQTLSTLAGQGETSPAALARNVLELPAFRGRVSQEEYKTLLRNMLAEGWIERMDGGGLILGLRGEKLTGHYSFFAVFPDEEAYRVIAGGREIGTLSEKTTEGALFTLAGRSWRTREINEERKEIYASPAAGAPAPKWSGAYGDMHEKIAQRMRTVLEEDAEYPYLLAGARGLLEQAREDARRLHCTRRCLLQGENDSLYFLPWTGTKQMRTMAALMDCGLREKLQLRSLDRARHYLNVRSGLSAQEFCTALHDAAIDPSAAENFLREGRAPNTDKYDFMAPHEMRRSAFVENEMDPQGAMRIFRETEC